jgi:hypothetical protein
LAQEYLVRAFSHPFYEVYKYILAEKEPEEQHQYDEHIEVAHPVGLTIRIVKTRTEVKAGIGKNQNGGHTENGD